jgi:hypothetical protein
MDQSTRSATAKAKAKRRYQRLELMAGGAGLASFVALLSFFNLTKV